MLKAEEMPDGYRLMKKAILPRSHGGLYSGMLIDPKDKNSSEACTIYLSKGIFSTEAIVYVRNHGNLIASGTSTCFTWPWKTKKVKPVIKAFLNAGIQFVRSDGTPFEQKESDVIPILVKEICRMLKLSDNEFVVVRRY